MNAMLCNYVQHSQPKAGGRYRSSINIEAFRWSVKAKGYFHPWTRTALVEHVPPLAVERLEHPVPEITHTARAVREAEAAKLQLEGQLKLN